jgi:haloacetate dehalogenase
MFERFTIEDIPVTDAVLHLRHGGNGSPVVLLHGHPRTGSTWHRVAPLLVAAGHTVVVPDLRGYGASRGPAPTADHRTASKRAMATDIVEAMTHLGHKRFDLVGHDRGSYAALRLALDHPDRVNRVALLDCLPITEHLERITPEFATRWFHWFFFAQPDVPERVINADPDAWYHADAQVMGAENHAEWLRAIHNPAVVRAMLEDYRAGLTLDRAAEVEDRSAGRMVESPLLVLWSLRDDLEQLFGDPVSIWRAWAKDVRGHGIDSGHHMAEEAPEALADALIEFFGSETSREH